MSDPVEPASSRAWGWLGLIPFLLCFWAWRSNLSLPFTGVDAWPLIADADQTLLEPLRPWTTRYLDGFWDGGTFWRPLTNLSFAIQRALFGDQAPAYHAMRLVAAAATACLIGWVAFREGERSVVGFLTASLFYVLHPIQAETLPVIARDADTWVASSLVATVAFLSVDSLRLRRVGLAACLCAPLFKEPGLLAPVLALFVLWRVRAGWRWSATVVAGTVFHLAWRIALLGGMGGYGATSEPVTPIASVPRLFAALFDHQQWGTSLIVVGLLVVGAGMVFARGAVHPRAWSPVVHACLLWMAGQVVLVAISPFRMRYAEGLVAPVAILVGIAVARLVGRGAEPLSRLAGVTCLASAAMMLGPGSPLIYRYAAWHESAELTQNFIETSREIIREQEEDEPVERRVGRFSFRAERIDGVRTLTIDPFPFRYQARLRPREGRVARTYLITPYSLRAALIASDCDETRSIQIRTGQPALDVGRRDLAASRRTP